MERVRNGGWRLDGGGTNRSDKQEEEEVKVGCLEKQSGV